MTREDITTLLPAIYQMTSNGRNFVDSDNEDRILVFGTEDGIRLVQTCVLWEMPQWQGGYALREKMPGVGCFIYFIYLVLFGLKIYFLGGNAPRGRNPLLFWMKKKHVTKTKFTQSLAGKLNC